MKCEVFLCPETAEYRAIIKIYGIPQEYTLCSPHVKGEKPVGGEFVYVSSKVNFKEEGQKALTVVLNRIKDLVVREDDEQYGNELRCAKCSELLYEIEDGDWLECLVNKGFEHECEKGD